MKKEFLAVIVCLLVVGIFFGKKLELKNTELSVSQTTEQTSDFVALNPNDFKVITNTRLGFTITVPKTIEQVDLDSFPERSVSQEVIIQDDGVSPFVDITTTPFPDDQYLTHALRVYVGQAKNTNDIQKFVQKIKGSGCRVSTDFNREDIPVWSTIPIEFLIERGGKIEKETPDAPEQYTECQISGSGKYGFSSTRWDRELGAFSIVFLGTEGPFFKDMSSDEYLLKSIQFLKK